MEVVSGITLAGGVSPTLGSAVSATLRDGALFNILVSCSKTFAWRSFKAVVGGTLACNSRMTSSAANSVLSVSEMDGMLLRVGYNL